MSIVIDSQMLDCYRIVDCRLPMVKAQLIFQSLLEEKQSMPDRLLRETMI